MREGGRFFWERGKYIREGGHVDSRQEKKFGQKHDLGLRSREFQKNVQVYTIGGSRE